MTTLKVLTDSSCDLPPDYFREYGIGVVPISIRFGDRVYLEGVDLDRNAFYQKVNELGVLPKTSQPSVGEFAAAYRACAAQGYDTLLSVHVASTLSGTMNSATLAAQEVAGEVKVIPYDSLSGSAAMGFMCVEAVRMARAGKSVSEIVTRLNEVRPRVRIALTLATLRYAQMSGRISNLQSLIASLLNIKPIICLHAGRLLADERVRTRHAALDRLLDMTREAAGQAAVNLAVIHSQVREEAEQLLERAKQSLNYAETFVDDIATSLAVHFGPGVIGTVVYPCAVREGE